MQTYYNFTISQNEISFDPYWYNNANIIRNSIFVILLLALGTVLLLYNNSPLGLSFSILVSLFLLAKSLYTRLIRNKTTYLFDKRTDAFYKITPFGKGKISTLSSILDVTSKSSSNSFSFQLIVKGNTSPKSIPLTSIIKSASLDNPEVRFLQMEIIPQLELFLTTKRNTIHFFDSENCSSI